MAAPAARRRPPSGFTLIELLVVIAIIAILAAILFPVFAKAREKARTASCTSNLKQLSLGMLQYTQDYDETMPGVISGGTLGTGGPGPYGGWIFITLFPGNLDPTRGSIYPYVKNAQVYVCPSDAAKPGVSYAYTSSLTTYNTAAAIANPGLSIAQITDPAQWVALNEESNVNGTTDDGLNAVSGGNGQAPTPRHTDGSLYAFCDGHAKWLRAEAVGAGKQFHY